MLKKRERSQESRKKGNERSEERGQKMHVVIFVVFKVDYYFCKLVSVKRKLTDEVPVMIVLAVK